MDSKEFEAPAGGRKKQDDEEERRDRHRYEVTHTYWNGERFQAAAPELSTWKDFLFILMANIYMASQYWLCAF